MKEREGERDFASRRFICLRFPATHLGIEAYRSLPDGLPLRRATHGGLARVLVSPLIRNFTSGSAFVVARSNGKRKGRSSLTITSLSSLPFPLRLFIMTSTTCAHTRSECMYVSDGKSGKRAIRDDSTERFNRR